MIVILPLEVFGEVRGTVFILKRASADGEARGVFELELRWWVAEYMVHAEWIPPTAVVERLGGPGKSDMDRGGRWREREREALQKVDMSSQQGWETV